MKDLISILLKGKIVWVLILLVIALNYIGTMDFEDAINQQTHYCRMVKLNTDTDGQAGWPDYKGTYSEWCSTNP